SLTWVLELIIGGIQRYPNFTQRAALVSGAWFHIVALLPLFLIFPDRTLALCDYLLRSGLSVEVVATCSQLLRRRIPDATRSRITNLLLLPAALEPQHARAVYTARYDARKAGHRKLLEEIHLPLRSVPLPAGEWHEVDDDAMTYGLQELLDRLARMWGVEKDHEIVRETEGLQRVSLARDNLPLGPINDVVARLAAVAADLNRGPNTRVRALEQLEALGKQHDGSTAGTSMLTLPIRGIVTDIVTVWRNLHNPPLPKEGIEIGKYKLGSMIAEGRLGSVFEVDEDPKPAEGEERVIKVLRDVRK